MKTSWTDHLILPSGSYQEPPLPLDRSRELSNTFLSSTRSSVWSQVKVTCLTVSVVQYLGKNKQRIWKYFQSRGVSNILFVQFTSFENLIFGESWM